MEKIRIYLIARISKDAHEWNNKITNLLDPEKFDVFKPHEHNPWNHRHETFSKNVFDTDLEAIKKSHIGLCLPEFGNDCAWECGWFANSKKPLIAFVENQTAWLRDWMIKGGIDHVITNNEEAFEKMKADPILKHKIIIFISNMQELTNVVENIYSKQYKSKLFGHLLNLRPYSWVDMLLTGFVAKFFVTKNLSFEIHDLALATGILSLWFFFNSILEIRHDYAYRQKESAIFPIIYILIALAIGFFTNLFSIVFAIASVLLVLLYLQKNRSRILGIMSSPIRGVIQATYFLFAISLYSSALNNQAAILGLIVFLLYTARAIVGDLRDIKQNTISNKKTIPVVFGLINSHYIIFALFFSAILLGTATFGTIYIFLPLALFAIGMFINKSGYVLHQLMIQTTSFVMINFTAFFTEQNLLFFILIYLGIWLNFIFYPLLERKSNPKFV